MNLRPIHRATDMHPGNHPNDEEGSEPVITIDVRINGRRIAFARAVNESGLADFSDYRVSAHEVEAPHLGIPDRAETWRVETHRRDQSCFALVEKIAAAFRLFQDNPAKDFATGGEPDEDVCPICDGGPGNEGVCLCPTVPE